MTRREARPRGLRVALFAFILCCGFAAGSAQSLDAIRNPHPYGSSDYQAFLEFSKKHEVVLAAYREIADIFNRRLGDRYPFGSLETRDVPRWDVCDYFKRFGPQIVAVQSALAPRKEFAAEVRFLNRMDTIGVFLSGTACSRFNQPIRIGFQPEEAETIASRPARLWTLTDDFGRARVPHGVPTLDWRFGAPLALDITWAAHTGLRPRRATADDSFQTPDSATVRFRMTGDWALMRFVDVYREPYGMNRDEDATTVTLRFRVPLVPILVSSGQPSRSGESLNSLNVRLRFEHYAAGGPRQHLKWPEAFPVTAP